jgi:hypothetical protein
MTTREFLKARVVRFYRIPIALVLLVSAIYWRSSVLLSALNMIAIAAYLTIFIMFMRRTPCLRCASPLQSAALNWGSKRQPAPRCPHCGISIDEPVSDPRPVQAKS